MTRSRLANTEDVAALAAGQTEAETKFRAPSQPPRTRPRCHRYHDNAECRSPDLPAADWYDRGSKIGTSTSAWPAAKDIKGHGRVKLLTAPFPLPDRCRAAAPRRHLSSRRAATRRYAWRGRHRYQFGNHSVRATGIMAYLKNGGALEKAVQFARSRTTPARARRPTRTGTGRAAQCKFKQSLLLLFVSGQP